MLSKLPNPFNTRLVVKRMLEALNEIGFDPEQDMLALVGPVIHASVLFGVCLRKWGRVRVLMHDARGSGSSSYKVRTVSMVEAREVTV